MSERWVNVFVEKLDINNNNNSDNDDNEKKDG